MMKISVSRRHAGVLSLLIASLIAALLLYARVAPARKATRTTTQVREDYGRLPLSFEVRERQHDWRGGGGSL